MYYNVKVKTKFIKKLFIPWTYVIEHFFIHNNASFLFICFYLHVSVTPYAIGHYIFLLVGIISEMQP